MQELIDKRELLYYLGAIKPDECVSAYGEAAVDVINHIESYTNKMPTIESEPVRHGRWIVHTTWHGMFGLIYSECSECKFDRNGDLSSWKFCPMCGARMDATDTNVGGKGGADNDT